MSIQIAKLLTGVADRQTKNMLIDVTSEQGIGHMAQRVEGDIPFFELFSGKDLACDQLFFESGAEIMAGYKPAAPL